MLLSFEILSDCCFSRLYHIVQDEKTSALKLVLQNTFSLDNRQQPSASCETRTTYGRIVKKPKIDPNNIQIRDEGSDICFDQSCPDHARSAHQIAWHHMGTAKNVSVST